MGTDNNGDIPKLDKLGGIRIVHNCPVLVWPRSRAEISRLVVEGYLIKMDLLADVAISPGNVLNLATADQCDKKMAPRHTRGLALKICL